MTNERPRAGVQLDDGACGSSAFSSAVDLLESEATAIPPRPPPAMAASAASPRALAISVTAFAICSVLFAIGSRVAVSSSLVGGERMRLTSRRKISKRLARENVGYVLYGGSQRFRWRRQRGLRLPRRLSVLGVAGLVRVYL